MTPKQIAKLITEDIDTPTMDDVIDQEERGKPVVFGGYTFTSWSVGRDPTEFGWYIDDNKFSCADFDAAKRKGWGGISNLVGSKLASILRSKCSDLNYLCVWLSDSFNITEDVNDPTADPTVNPTNPAADPNSLENRLSWVAPQVRRGTISLYPAAEYWQRDSADQDVTGTFNDITFYTEDHPEGADRGGIVVVAEKAGERFYFDTTGAIWVKIQ
jgi:hypothetical protein